MKGEEVEGDAEMLDSLQGATGMRARDRSKGFFTIAGSS